MLTVSPALIDNIQNNANVFMAFSNITLAGAERLTNLNLNAARTALDDGAAVSRLMFDSNRATTPQTGIPGKTAENALAYFQNAQEIAAETHREVTKLMTSYFALQTNGMGQTSNWLEGIQALTTLWNPLTEANQQLMADINSNVASRKRTAA